MKNRYLSKKENVIKDKKESLKLNSNKILKLLFQSKSHYGKKIQKTNPYNYPNLMGVRLGNSIIDLSITTQNLFRAFKFIQQILLKNKYLIYKKSAKIVLVCNSKQIEHLKIFNKNKEFGSFIHIINSSWKSQYFSKVFNFKKKKKTKILAVILLSTDNFNDIIKETKSHNIPLISLINTGQNFNIVNYPILVNTANLMSLYNIITLFEKLLNIKKL